MKVDLPSTTFPISLYAVQRGGRYLTVNEGDYFFPRALMRKLRTRANGVRVAVGAYTALAMENARPRLCLYLDLPRSLSLFELSRTHAHEKHTKAPVRWITTTNLVVLKNRAKGACRIYLPASCNPLFSTDEPIHATATLYNNEDVTLITVVLPFQD